MIAKSIATIFAVIYMLVLLHAGEPLRAGIDVPEPKIINKVDIAYSDAEKISITADGAVVLDVLIDDQGTVADVTERSYTPADLEAVKSAVKKWRFSPTLVDDKAVPVSAMVVIVFSLQGNPNTVDLGIKGGLLPLLSATPRWLCYIPTKMDHSGNLIEMATRPHMRGSSLDGSPAPDLCMEYHDYEIIPALDVPFSMIEQKMKRQTPSSLYRLRALKYRFLDSRNSTRVKHSRPGLERLFYSTLVVSDDSQLIQLAGVDPNVEPPKFDLDHKRIAESFDASSNKSGAVFFYTLFVDKNGSILGIDEGNGNNPPAIIDVLSQSHVITPGMRNGVPVPTAVIMAIRVP